MYYFLQAETDTRFAEVQQQLREREAEVRDLRVGIHSSHIVGNLAHVGGWGGGGWGGLVVILC